MPEPSSSPRAIVLLSGGLDSTTTLAIARQQGFEPYALTFWYGQRHASEVEAARAIARQFGVARHIVIDIDLRALGGSALTSDLPVPKDRDLTAAAEIPSTYVPARNTVFLSYALGWAEVLEAQDVFIGVNALDYSGYPDCRPEYLEAFEQMAVPGDQGAVSRKAPRLRIHAPLIALSPRRRSFSAALPLASIMDSPAPVTIPRPMARRAGVVTPASFASKDSPRQG